MVKKKTTKKKVTKRKRKVAKPKGLVAMPSPAHPEIQLMVASEMADDSMIEAELLGEVLPHFVYQFSQEGKDVTGMTVKGVSEVVRRINRNPKSGSKIRLNPEFIRVERNAEYDGQKGVEVMVYAEDLVTGGSAWGAKFEPYTKKGRRGEYPNTFPLEKALSKAERNAKRKLIPETMATKMIQKLIKEDPGTIQKIEAPAPREMSVSQKFAQSKQMIDACKNVDILYSWRERIPDHPDYTADQKQELVKLIDAQIDRVINPV